PRFPLNLGLRYELPIPEKERFNRASWFNPIVKSPLNVTAYPNLRGGIEFALQGNDHRSPHDTDRNNWAPRIGFAYQFLPHMVVRAGYGIYYGLTRAQISSPLGPGFRVGTSWTASLDNNVTQYTSLSLPFKDGLNSPPGGKLACSPMSGSAPVCPRSVTGTPLLISNSGVSRSSGNYRTTRWWNSRILEAAASTWATTP